MKGTMSLMKSRRETGEEQANADRRYTICFLLGKAVSLVCTVIQLHGIHFAHP
jgi:hypothetical protein